MPKEAPKRKPADAEPVPTRELQAVRDQERAAMTPEETMKKGGNVFIGTLNIIMQPLGRFIDPVAKICYEPLAAHWEKKYRRPHGPRASLVLAIDLFLLTLVGVLAVLAIFGRLILPALPTPSLMGLDVDAPSAITSGAVTEFAISYRNPSDEQYRCAQLLVELPENAYVVGELPRLEGMERLCDTGGFGPYAARTSGDRVEAIGFALGDVSPAGEGAITFAGRVYGPTGTTSVLSATLTYWEEARTKPSRVGARRDIPIVDTVFPLEITAPSALYRGRQTAFAVRYAYGGAERAANASIRLSAPDDFVITGAEPAFTRDHEWFLEALEPGESGVLTVNGYFRTAASAAAPTFTAAGFLREGEAVAMASTVRINADPRASALALAHEVTGPGDRRVLHPGETVTVTLRYRNGGDEAVTDFRAALDATERYVEPLSPPGLRWDAVAFPELARIGPGAAGTLTATFVVKEEITPADLEDDDHPRIRIGVSASYAMADDPVRPVRIDSPTEEFAVTTRPKVTAAAFYYTKDGDQVGVGPLPPKVGETTRFRVFLHVTNTTGAMEDAKVEASLPAGVEWTGRTSVTGGEAVDYLPMTRRVRWTIGRVEPFVDTVGRQVGASFEAALTPSGADVGTEPVLLTNISISGKDEQTGYPVRSTTDAVTTALTFDPKGRGKGVVERKK